MTTIETVDAWEILDSRGDPTLRVRVDTRSASGTFSVPAGASTGSRAVTERRDGDDRFGGRGVRQAVRNVRDVLGPRVEGLDAADQRAIDAVLVEADGTENLDRLGGNAVLGVSGATARAAAAALDRPLFAHLASDVPGGLPLPMVNVLSGGLHAEDTIDVQDILVVPTGAATFEEALASVWDVRMAVRDHVATEAPPLVADEGGFARPFDSIEAALDVVVDAIIAAGYRAAPDAMGIALDVAATHFYDTRTGTYDMTTVDGGQDSAALIDRVAGWVDAYPIVSVEDPLADTDFSGWDRAGARLGDRVQLLGDDLLVTDADAVARAAAAGRATAVLVKPNQAGTITRATSVLETAMDHGLGTVVSARSGETCDTTIADLAVAHDARQIKIGSLARSERLAKYNRLLELRHRYDRELATPLALPGAD